MSDADTIRQVKAFLAFQMEMGAYAAPRAVPGMLPEIERAPEDTGAEPVIEAAVVPEAIDEETGRGEPETLEAFAARVTNCEKCTLSGGRKTVVFGSGNPDADVMFIGEAPGRDEDIQGLPFVGAAGELLTKMIASIQFDREEVYIANVIKCRPPGNRDPQPEEIAACEPYLLRQIDMIQPRVICTLGRFAAQTLLQSTESMGRLRGQVHDFRGIKLVPTYHPAALLRNPQWKRPTWEDLKRLRFEYDGLEL